MPECKNIKWSYTRTLSETKTSHWLSIIHWHGQKCEQATGTEKDRRPKHNQIITFWCVCAIIIRSHRGEKKTAETNSSYTHQIQSTWLNCGWYCMQWAWQPERAKPNPVKPWKPSERRIQASWRSTSLRAQLLAVRYFGFYGDRYTISLICCNLSEFEVFFLLPLWRISLHLN